MNKSLHKIMYVDDDDDIRTIVEMTLTNIGNYDVFLCNSGKMAIKNIKKYNPDLIILDVMMPEMDGITTFKNIEKENIPIIFMTAKGQSHEKEELLNLGAEDVIVKPFEPIELPNLIQSIWNNI